MSDTDTDRSSRAWIIGRGHVDLAEARRWAVEQVEAAEARYEEAQAQYLRKADASRKAHEAASRAMDERDRAQVALEHARADLAYRMGDGNKLERQEQLARIRRREQGLAP